MKVSKVNKLIEVLNNMEIGDELKIRKYVSENWESFNYYTKRSFDVTLCNAKKLLPSKKFEVNSFKITRL